MLGSWQLIWNEPCCGQHAFDWEADSARTHAAATAEPEVFRKLPSSARPSAWAGAFLLAQVLR